MAVQHDPDAHHADLLDLFSLLAEKAYGQGARGDHDQAFETCAALLRLLLKTEWVRYQMTTGPLQQADTFVGELAAIQFEHMVTAAVEDQYHIGRLATRAAIDAYTKMIQLIHEPDVDIYNITPEEDVAVDVYLVIHDNQKEEGSE